MDQAESELDDWLQATFSSAREVLSTMNCCLEEVSPPDDHWLGGGAYVSIDTEAHSYLLALVTEEPFHYRLTSALLGASVSQSPDYLRDAMGEISNMIAGMTKAKMAKSYGGDLTLGLPIYIRGEFLGTSAGRTQRKFHYFSADGFLCQALVIQQQVSGEAVRRRQVERALRDSEERQRAIFETAPDAVITTDADGQVLTYNSAARRIFAYYDEQMGEKSISSLLRIRDQIGQQPRIGAEGTGTRADGSTFPVEVSISSFRFRETIQYAYLVRDTTLRELARQALEDANQRTIELSHAAGKAEVAADVLHNVGNVLNSINTTSSLLVSRLAASRLPHLRRVVALLEGKGENLGTYLEQDEKGKKVLPFLNVLAEDLMREKSDFESELAATQKNVEHIKRVIMTQQLIATAAGLTEEVVISELLRDALAHAMPLIEGAAIEVRQNVSSADRVFTDKNKLLQIVINLVKNACESIGEAAVVEPRLDIQSRLIDGVFVLDVIDNGMGISDEAMTRLFSHGFTTKKNGHGFGLHGSALYAKQLGGDLLAISEGPGRGATFTLRLPVSKSTASSPAASREALCAPKRFSKVAR